MTAAALKTALGLRYTPIAFGNLDRARSFASRAVKALWVVLGDNDGETGIAWVVCPADAARLERAGYEIL